MHHADRTPRRALLATTAALAVLVLALAAARMAGAAGAPAGAADRPAQAHAPAPRARRRLITVTLRDFTIAIAHRRHLRAGRYTFHVVNRGPSAHNLTIRRRGSRRTHATPTFSAGRTANLKVRLRRGRYVFYCSVPGHAALGMKVLVRVHRHA